MFLQMWIWTPVQMKHVLLDLVLNLHESVHVSSAGASNLVSVATRINT